MATITFPDVDAPVERDYSGVPTAELAALFNEHVDVDLRSFAERIGIDERVLNSLVVLQRYAFTGWTAAERILGGLGLNSAALLMHGDLHEVPARDSRASAKRVVEDTYWALDAPAPTDEEIDHDIDQLLELRRTLCVPSAEQEERLRRDCERQARRQERKKADL